MTCRLRVDAVRSSLDTGCMCRVEAQACTDLNFHESRRVLYHADKPGGKDVNEGKSVSETSFVHPQKVCPGG